MIHLWSLVGLHSRNDLPSGDLESPIDQAYIALWTEKNNLQIAFEQKEHKLKTREFKLKEMIRHNSEKASRRLNIYANVCISAVSVAVTMFALLVIVLLKKAVRSIVSCRFRKTACKSAYFIYLFQVNKLSAS